jgi:peptidoglycan/LPS O-acetylase OafA/YrhL
MVALCHCLLVLSVDGITNIWAIPFSDVAGVRSAIARFLLVFFNGGAAVTVFFVLSGYVLGLSLDKSRQTIPRTLYFYLKRVFRLYPAHIVTLSGIVVSVMLFHEYQLFEAAGAWYVKWYRYEIEAGTVISNLLLKEVYLNHIAWSLQVELAGSLFLPFAYLVNRRSGLVVNLVVLAALIVLSALSRNLLLFFLYTFYVGLMLPMITQRMKGLLAGGSGQVLLAAGFVLLWSARTLVGLGNMFGYILIETIGSALIIAYLLNTDNAGSWFNRFLAWDVINRLGRYSYSFYLLHFIVLYWTAYVIFHLVSPDLLSALPLFWAAVMALVTVPLTFWLSAKMYRFVEVPMIKTAKGFGARVFPRHAKAE